jgi:hypothetical protein
MVGGIEHGKPAPAKSNCIAVSIQVLCVAGLGEFEFGSSVFRQSLFASCGFKTHFVDNQT